MEESKTTTLSKELITTSSLRNHDSKEKAQKLYEMMSCLKENVDISLLTEEQIAEIELIISFGELDDIHALSFYKRFQHSLKSAEEIFYDITGFYIDDMCIDYLLY